MSSRISTGNAGLDTILKGGLPPKRLYLVEGSPGAGKTTFALQFLLDGVARGEACLYITLSETKEELHAVAASHGWDLAGIDLFELASAEQVLGSARDQSVLYSWEVELGETVKLIEDEVERINPRRVVFDSLSELRLLAQDPLRYRRQVLALKQYFTGRDATVVLIDDLTSMEGGRDTHLHSLCHGVVTLERLTLDFGPARRRMQVQKMRGVDFTAGYHDLLIRTGGMEIFPRLIAADHFQDFPETLTSSGIAELDNLFGGGPMRGTSTLITGPAGAGKTTIAMQFVTAACRRGERSTVYQFDERVGTLLSRSGNLEGSLQDHIDSGELSVRQINPAELSPGEFATMVRREVEERGVRMIVIDSLNGYLASMSQEQQLVLQMHELLSYLNQHGVVTFLINPQHGLVGTMSTSLNISYIADAVMLIRFFEAEGRIRKAISLLKNRGGAHEDAIRELRIDAQGIRIGEPLTTFRGVLTGTPEYVGSAAPLMEDRGAS
ncbi:MULTISPECIES: ATPase domain-containing protein [unclassified Sphingomonas]|uniref:ATPase domain-containing protein n=1 Tax=unclassified Sphingomonas TaxID=196159 RepID=UPI0006F5A1AB|nr:MULTISPECIES: ATPase domain-containing protein [unclassified Sphingomonas]KQX25575.1 circadian clock protein KaiC [Sphingomonas sp. Root1294]KQY66565.1 circadian clock protein KaiC [Sphingomonas sp. Root50]KRB90113.1 circadian clock protein KaiC [Sphingomonas sp. Root720]